MFHMVNKSVVEKVSKMFFKVWLLQTVAFLDLFAVGLIVPLIAGHARSLGAGHVYVGLMGSVYSGFQLASGPLIGSFSDLKGRKSTLIGALLICSIGYTGLGLVNSLFVILVIRAILGLFKHTQMLVKALVPDYEESDKKQCVIFGKMSAISAIGMTIGPVIGGHIAEECPEQSFTFLSAVVGVCFITNAGLVYILPKTKSDMKQKRRTAGKNKVPTSIAKTILNGIEPVHEFWKIDWSKYGAIFLFKGLLEFALALYYANYGLYLKISYELTPKHIGYIISFQSIIKSVSSYFIGYINSFYTKDRDYTTRNVHVFLALSLAMVGLIYSVNIYLYTLFLIPFGISNSVGKLVCLEMLLKKGNDDHRATLIGISNSMRALSGVIAPTISGFISQCFGVPYILYAPFFISSLGCLVSYQYKSIRMKVVKKD